MLGVIAEGGEEEGVGEGGRFLSGVSAVQVKAIERAGVLKM